MKYAAAIQLLKQISGQENTLTIPRVYFELTGNLTQALVLNQIVFWCGKTKREDGYFYKTYKEWQEETALSERQVRYATEKLEPFGVKTKLKKANGAPTIHYFVDLDKLLELILTKCQNGFLQSVRMDSDKMSGTMDSYKVSETLTEELQKNTTEDINIIYPPSPKKDDEDDKIPYKKIIDHFNLMIGSKRNYKAKANRDLIKARWKEGYRFDDFVRVIDNMKEAWTDTKWEQYLQPETLFGNKFDKYLNVNGRVTKSETARGSDGIIKKYNLDVEREPDF